MNEIGELCGIAEEKDRGVIEYPIEVPFFGLDLGRKSLHGEPRSSTSEEKT